MLAGPHENHGRRCCPLSRSTLNDCSHKQCVFFIHHHHHHRRRRRRRRRRHYHHHHHTQLPFSPWLKAPRFLYSVLLLLYRHRPLISRKTGAVWGGSENTIDAAGWAANRSHVCSLFMLGLPLLNIRPWDGRLVRFIPL